MAHKDLAMLCPAKEYMTTEQADGCRRRLKDLYDDGLRSEGGA
jgi:hypothetical protein